MTPLVSNPKVVIFAGTDKFLRATNISPELEIVECESEKEFLELSQGLPFEMAYPKQSKAGLEIKINPDRTFEMKRLDSKPSS